MQHHTRGSALSLSLCLSLSLSLNLYSILIYSPYPPIHTRKRPGAGRLPRNRGFRVGRPTKTRLLGLPWEWPGSVLWPWGSLGPLELIFGTVWAPSEAPPECFWAPLRCLWVLLGRLLGSLGVPGRLLGLLLGSHDVPRCVQIAPDRLRSTQMRPDHSSKSRPSWF